MKVKNITIGIKGMEKGLKEFAEVFKRVQKRQPVKKYRGVHFVSLEAMRQILTPKRLELLHLIREKKPDSIYELARLSGRDLKNVQDDVVLLARIELVSLSREKKARERTIPRVGYDSLNLHIPVI